MSATGAQLGRWLNAQVADDLTRLERFYVSNVLATYELGFTNEVSAAYDLRDQVLSSQPGLEGRVANAMREFPAEDWTKPDTMADIARRSGYLDAREQILDQAD